MTVRIANAAGLAASAPWWAWARDATDLVATAPPGDPSTNACLNYDGLAGRGPFPVPDCRGGQKRLTGGRRGSVPTATPGKGRRGSPCCGVAALRGQLSWLSTKSVHTPS